MRINNHPILESKENSNKVEFLFDGKKMLGLENEPVSSALFANNVKKFSIHKKDHKSQGIFCANGQCSQCTVIIDGIPLKSCVTPLKAGMDVRTMDSVPPLPADDKSFSKAIAQNYTTEILVVGAGPSGLTAAIELAKQGFKVLVVEDKEKLGGKLLLQTHKFFGSEEDCYAGTRGYKIGEILEKELCEYENVEILRETSVVAVYKDKKVGVFIKNSQYALIDFDGIVISSGAREKSLVFNGNDLPGVYGAGAFQTLVNRDLIKSSNKIFIVGSGNVGLIAAYHALQAGIEVAGIVDILSKVNGYKVHSDKIKRMGVPVILNSTVISVDGDDQVERVTIAKVDKNFNPILETAQTFKVDTVLIATGLTPVDEFYNQAKEFGCTVIKAGDADEIAEASSAMFGGRIAGLKMAKMLGKDIEIDNQFYEKATVLKSHPGEIYDFKEAEITNSIKPIFHCIQEIPCNPCTSVCPKNAISLKNKIGNIMDVPEFTGECIGCGLCVAVCPGLAVTLAKKIDDNFAEVTLPHEFIVDFKEGDFLDIMDRDGNFLENAEILKIKFNKKYSTTLVVVKMSLKNTSFAAGIRVQDEKISKPEKEAEFEYLPDNGIVCRCEKVSVKEITDFITDFRVRDVNQLKQIRVGMGACGSKTCSVLLPRVFGKAGVDWKDVESGTIRPLSVEVPMSAIVNENKKD